jgi:hypothetical protein
MQVREEEEEEEEEELSRSLTGYCDLNAVYACA